MTINVDIVWTKLCRSMTANFITQPVVIAFDDRELLPTNKVSACGRFQTRRCETDSLTGLDPQNIHLGTHEAGV